MCATNPHCDAFRWAFTVFDELHLTKMRAATTFVLEKYHAASRTHFFLFFLFRHKRGKKQNPAFFVFLVFLVTFGKRPTTPPVSFLVPSSSKWPLCWTEQDGPTHQPVETVSGLRVFPNMDVLRPADPEETAAAYAAALDRKDGPTALILTRQNVRTLKEIPVRDRGGSCSVRWKF